MAGAVLAATLTLTACGGDTGGGPMGSMGHGGSSSPTTSGTSSTSRAGDVMFAQMMIPHHQQAVEMADLAVRKGSSPEVKELAGQIKAAQGPEIDTMKGWLRQWNAPSAAGPGHGDHGSGGMMSDTAMKELSDATGPAFDRMWISMMIEHHEGAVEMAKAVLGTTSNPGVRQLAQAIVDGQNKEIVVMKGLH